MRSEVEDRTRLLADLATALTAASADLDKVLDTAARAVSRLVGDTGVVRVINDAGLLGATTVYHPDPELSELFARMFAAVPVRPDEGHAGALYRTHKPLVDNAVDHARLLADTPPDTRPYLARVDLRAMLMVPLLADGRYLGYLAMGRIGREQPYTEADVELACDIAARVALAVAVAQLVAALRVEQDNYRQIMDTSLEGVWRIDRGGLTTFVNNRMAEILGVRPEEMLGEPLTRWTADADEIGVRLARRWAGRREQYEIQLVRADGSPVWVQVAAAPVLGRDGTPCGSLAMVSDITDRVRGRELAARLEQLQRLDSLGQLAGGIAHDFNNLLGIIGGFAELLRGDLPDGSAQRALADQIGSAVEKGSALTRQLLAFGRGDAGRVGIHDVSQVLAELAPLLRRTLGEQVTVLLSPAGRPCRVRIDRGQLEQVVINLAGNARDAMPGGGELRLECEHVLLDRAELGEAGGGGEGRDWFVRLAVTDTGTGMDAEALRHAFEPFYTTKPPGYGTGLGLASVYGTVRNSGGLVRLRSEPGRGTTVTVFLPAYLARPSTSDAPAGPAPPRRADEGGGRHVLLVEDSAELADVTRRLLEPAGYLVTTTYSPIDALARLDAGLTVDLVVTDVVMPQMTGPELAAAIRTRRPELPVIYTSGYAADGLGHRVQLDAGSILVEKPFTRASLLGAIGTALR